MKLNFGVIQSIKFYKVELVNNVIFSNLDDLDAEQHLRSFLLRASFNEKLTDSIDRNLTKCVGFHIILLERIGILHNCSIKTDLAIYLKLAIKTHHQLFSLFSSPTH